MSHDLIKVATMHFAMRIWVQKLNSERQQLGTSTNKYLF